MDRNRSNAARMAVVSSSNDTFYPTGVTLGEVSTGSVNAEGDTVSTTAANSVFLEDDVIGCVLLGIVPLDNVGATGEATIASHGGTDVLDWDARRGAVDFGPGLMMHGGFSVKVGATSAGRFGVLYEIVQR